MSRQDRSSWFAAQQPRRKSARRRRACRRPSSFGSPAILSSYGRRLRVEQLEDRRMLAVITVTSLADNLFPDGAVTLREAVLAANTNVAVGDALAGDAGADTILFDATLFATPQTITLGGTELAITEALTIDATALTANVTIDANNASRIFNITATTGNFTLAGLTLTGGTTTGDNVFFLDTTFSGGAIRSLTTGSLTIDQSTVSGNSTAGNNADGGGIFSLGTVTLTGSTVSGNSAAGDGGGIFSSGTVTLTSSTVSGNRANDSNATGGGIWNDFDTITVTNSIVAGNTAGGGSPDIDPGTAGTFSVNYSLIGTGISPDAGTSGNNVVTNNPMLSPLTDNGGPTATHALLAGSLAIDAGNPGIIFNPAEFDQRGAPFVRVFDDPVASGSGIDIGAFELQPVAPSADFNNDNDIDGGDFLAWQRGFGTPNPAKSNGDADNDGNVDGDDLGFWESQFGGPAPLLAAASAAASASVDQPSPLESVAVVAQPRVTITTPITPTPITTTLTAAELVSVAQFASRRGSDSSRASLLQANRFEAIDRAFGTTSPDEVGSPDKGRNDFDFLANAQRDSIRTPANHAKGDAKGGIRAQAADDLFATLASEGFSSVAHGISKPTGF